MSIGRAWVSVALLLGLSFIAAAYVSNNVSQTAAISAAESPVIGGAGNDCGEVPRGNKKNSKEKTKVQWRYCISLRCEEGKKISAGEGASCPNTKDSLCKKYCISSATSKSGITDCCQITEQGNGCTKVDGKCKSDVAQTPNQKKGPTAASCYGTSKCGDNPNWKDSHTDTRGKYFDPSKDPIAAVGKGSPYKYGDKLDITRTDTGEKVTVTVRDYCPGCGTGKIDLTGAAAQQLGFDLQKGVVPIQVSQVSGTGNSIPSTIGQSNSFQDSTVYAPGPGSQTNNEMPQISTVPLASNLVTLAPTAPVQVAAYQGSQDAVQSLDTFSPPSQSTGPSTANHFFPQGFFYTAYLTIQAIGGDIYNSAQNLFQKI